jgi:hypothetical protein
MPAPDVTLPGISKAGLLRPDHKLQPLGCLLISTSGTIGHVDSRISNINSRLLQVRVLPALSLWHILVFSFSRHNHAVLRSGFTNPADV